jgi:hypothetical protein
MSKVEPQPAFDAPSKAGRFGRGIERRLTELLG